MRGPAYYDTKGACIYCGATGVELADEHIVAYALGGSHVLRKASCPACAKITGEFERQVARDLWGDARVAYDAPSRRKRERPSHLTMEGGGAPLQVPAAEFPAGLLFYKMGPAGILRGYPESFDTSSAWTMVIVGGDDRRERFLAKHPDRKVALKFRHVPAPFARMLAKIGYCQVLTDLDPGDFRPICLPYIMGKKPNLSFVVGGAAEDQPPQPDDGYVLTTGAFGSTERLMLVAEVRLYANTHTPTYNVVVGDVTGSGNVERVLQKLGITASDVANPVAPNADWLPRVLPLPFWVQGG